MASRVVIDRRLGPYVTLHCTARCLQGPIENLQDHLSDPAAINAFNYATKFTPSN